MLNKEFINIVQMHTKDKKGRTISKERCKRVVEAFWASIADVLAENPEEKIKFFGYGTFSVTTVPEKECVNPKNRKKIVCPKKNHPRFKPGNTLKSEVNKYLE